YYLPRIDKLTLTRDRQFKILSGTPSLVPQTPTDQPGAMTLYTLGVPAYTYFAANVVMNYIENKRYTMRDIGGLDNRIQQLEYYASLSQLDQSALKTTVLYQDGTTAKEQFGVVTDSFVDFSVADPNNPDLQCYIAGGELLPMQITTPVEFTFGSATGTYGVNDRTYSVGFGETPSIIQNTASDFVQVQPYAFGQFNGDIQLRPQTDIWYSDSLVPQIIGPSIPAPAPTPPPVVLISTLGLGGVGNKANLNPVVQTNTPPVRVPPPAASPVAAAPSSVGNICIEPADLWYSGYSRFGIGYRNAIPFNSNPYSSLYGGTAYNFCVKFNRSQNGFGIVRQGNWIPTSAPVVATSTSTYTVARANAASQIRFSGFGIGILGGGR
ncbi:MAG: DUF4815 domain-containing protein, partial [Candidatus Dormibacteria bacterium]